MKDIKGQLTLRGILIGVIGCIIITAASVYTALKMGALPWPIIFAALISLVFLRIFGSRSLNEANVTHTVMSAGAMVAGGLAFTIPGIWILGLDGVSFLQMLLVALAGTILGLIASIYFRKQFIEEQKLEFPMGQAAAQTLKAGDTGGRLGWKLFGAMGFSGLWTVLRDLVGVIPAMLFGNVALPGITFGIYMSPMMLSVGFLVGTAAMVAWFVGGVVQLLIVSGGTIAGLYDVTLGQAFNSSLGMGMMMGCGIAVICKDVLPRGLQALKTYRANTTQNIQANKDSKSSRLTNKRNGALALVAAAIAFIFCMLAGIDSLASALVVLLSFVTVAMSAQSVGQTGIDPMEIFGLIVLLIVSAIGDTPEVKLFFVAAVIAVACGLGGDVMNDFKAGYVIDTSPKAQFIGQAIGGLIGAFVAAVALFALVSAYGSDAFGIGKEFVSAQANVVATLVAGIPNVPAFVIGLVLGFGIYLLGGPAMMLGLGIYLPFYLTLTGFLGCIIKLGIDAILKQRRKHLPEAEKAIVKEKTDQDGLVIASGLLGGESVVGVCLALAAVAMGLGAL